MYYKIKTLSYVSSTESNITYQRWQEWFTGTVTVKIRSKMLTIFVNRYYQF